LQLGLLIAAGLTALAVLPAWLTTKTPPDPVTPKPTLLHPARYAGWGFGSPQHHFHRLTLRTLRRWLAAARSSFDLFLLTWLLAMAGSAAFFALYPVLMRQVFGLSPGFSSTAFAVAAGLGLALYSPAGNWSDHFGPGRVLKIGLGGRLLAFVCILILGLAGGSQGWLALGAFTVVVLSWSLLSVGGTALTASLSPVGEGEGLGLFNAVYALAGVVGAAFGGWAAGRWGYNVATALAVTGVGLGLLITFLSHIARSSPESRSKSELNRK
jgi:predicted MFS family arabinose efflux permease